MVRLSRRLRAYDEATGQVYDETQVPVTSMVSAWPNKCNGRKQKPQDYHHRGRGCSSLHDMALRYCAFNIDLFLPQDLQLAEWYFSKKIYNHLQKNQNLTANAWAIFQQAYPDEEELSHTYPIRIPASHGDFAIELPSIQQWLRTLPFDHLSLLNMQGLRLQLTHLISLTNLPNLGVLLLRHPHVAYPEDLDDKTMRDWGRAVQEKGAFTNLKVVGFHCFPPSLEATLKCLATFPVLRICTVEPFNPTRSAEDAERRLTDAALPFRLVSSEGGFGNDDPESIWMRNDLSGHSKMKMLYDVADKSALEHLHKPQILEEPSESAVLSVLYGAELRFAYSAYPLWFKRLGDVKKEHQYSELGKRSQYNSEDSVAMKGGAKRRRMRPGKQSDIGSLLGGFG